MTGVTLSDGKGVPHSRYGVLLSNISFVRTVLEASADCIELLGLDGAIQFMNPGGLVLMETDDFSPIAGSKWLDYWEGGHRDTAEAIFAAALQGEAGRFQGYARTLKGNLRWWDVQLTAVLNDNNDVTGVLAIARDTTELKRADERRQLLMEEMRHRVKNALAVVQAIASQTFRAPYDAVSARRTFHERLQALARAYDALVRSDWTSAKLHDLVEGAIALFGQETRPRITIKGPAVALNARAALAVALALHELCTNASKYGAISNQDGRIDIHWQIARGSEDRLQLLWQERNGPAVKPPSRRGFGTLLIERALRQQLGGKALLSYAPEGVTFELDVPLARVQEPS